MLATPIVHDPFVFHLGPLQLTGFGIAMMAAFGIAHWVAQTVLQERGDEYAELLASHHHVRGQFGRHGGVEVNTQGDAFFVLGRAPPSRGRQPAELATYFSEIEFEFGADRSRGALPAEKTFEWYTRSMALLGQLQEVRDPSDR